MESVSANDTDDGGELESAISGNEPSESIAPNARPTVLLSPRLTRTDLEVSVHTCPRSLLRELKLIFPELSPNLLQRILAIPTCQNAAVDLVQVGKTVEDEKDKLLQNFMTWARPLCQSLNEKGFWADYIDPCSGLPMLTSRANKVYSEVDGMQVLLRYRTQSAGGCKILLHPVWGSSVYPATVFTTAPPSVVIDALAEEFD